MFDIVLTTSQVEFLGQTSEETAELAASQDSHLCPVSNYY